MLTLDLIRAAQKNDLNGITAVLAEMDERVNRLAAQTASAMATNSARYADYHADFRQDALAALFEYLPRWEGNSVDEFRAFIYQSIAGELKSAYRAQRNPGADKDALSVFKQMLEQADGDLHVAEKLAQTKPRKGLRLSADRAYAARMAWEGTTSLEKERCPKNNWGSDQPFTAADRVASPADEVSDEIRPKVGHGAALEALSVLRRYAGVAFSPMHPREIAEQLPELVEHLEASVCVPRDPERRRLVLDAMSILRSAVSTTSDSDLAEDLRDPADAARDARAMRIGAVRAALEKVKVSRRLVLQFSFGIGGAEEFGWGDGCDLEGLAAHLDVSLSTIKVNRSQAKSEFAREYIAIAARSSAEADSLWAAASAKRAHGGRK